MYRDRQLSAVIMVSVIIKLLKSLCIKHTDKIIKGVIIVGNYTENGFFLFSKLAQVKTFVRGHFRYIGQVKSSQANSGRNQNRLCCFSCCKFENVILLNCNMVGVSFFQRIKQLVNRRRRGISAFFFICNSSIFNHIHQHRKILFFRRCFIEKIEH